MNLYRDHLWFLLSEWIHEAGSMCQQYDVQLIFIKERFLDTYYLQFITPKILDVVLLSEILKIWKM